MKDEANAARLSETFYFYEDNSLLALIDSIPALIASVDCNMVLQFSNQPFKDWFSVEDDPHETSFPLVIGKHAFDQVQRHLGKVLVGQRAHFQMSMQTIQGTKFLDTTLSPQVDGRQNVKGFIFHSADVTEKNRTERVLTDYFENASIGLHWVNSEGIIVWANPAELQMLGYSRDEYIGRHISEFHADKLAIKDILNRLTNRQTLRNYTTDLLCKNGTIRHVSINSSVLWEGSKFIHTRCFTIDITEQKLAERALRESEERFRMMANLVPLVLLTTDDQGDCDFLSVRWNELTGVSAKKGMGKQWSNFLHPEDKEKVLRLWKQSVSEKRPFEARFRFMNGKGEYISVYANWQPKYDASQKFDGYIGILQDVSVEGQVRTSLERIVLDRTEDLRKKNAALKNAEQALLRKNEELERINNQLVSFAHVASHDLQEPLRKIQTYSNLLFETEGDKFSEKGKQIYQRIYESSGRMRNLIQDILTYSQSNPDEEKFEKVDLNILLREILGEIEVKINDKRAVIEIGHLPCVEAIRFQFHQLFLNLLSNALKFSKAGVDPVVNIRSEIVDGTDVPVTVAETDKAYYRITVSDNGIGFEPRFAHKIFEMFHRLHGRNEYEGTGIGLAICKKIVENHNGWIMAAGEPDAGATFRIYLPVS